MPQAPDPAPLRFDAAAAAALDCDTVRVVWDRHRPPDGYEWPARSGDAFATLGLVAAAFDVEPTEDGLRDALGATDAFHAAGLANVGAPADVITTLARRASKTLGGECWRSFSADVADRIVPDDLLSSAGRIAAMLLVGAVGVSLIVIGTRTLATGGNR